MMENERFYIHTADDINKHLMDTESDFNIHIEEVGGDEELLIQLCNLLNKQQATISRLEEVIDMTENALIINADMVFDDIGGRNGRNFRLKLTLETIDGGVTVSFNPMRLPQLLEQLGLERFSELEGTYVQIPKTRIGEQVKGIKSIMAKNNEKWFKTENDIYFGSEFFKVIEELKTYNLQHFLEWLVINGYVTDKPLKDINNVIDCVNEFKEYITNE